MAMNYAYNYAEIDPTTNMCIGFQSGTAQIPEEDMAANEYHDMFVQVSVNDPEHIGKYYINGNWYEDAEGAIPWTSSLL